MRRSFVLVLALCSCRSVQPSIAPAGEAQRLEAAGRTSDARLARLCSAAWDFYLQCEPLQATYLGDARMNGQLFLPSPDNESWRKRRTAELLAELEALDRSALAADDQLTWEFLHDLWSTQFASLGLEVDEASWNLDPRAGPQVDFLSVAAVQPAASDEQRAQLLQRWTAMGAYVDQCRINLERGVGNGRVACRAEIERVLAQVDELLRTPHDKSPLYEPARRPETAGAELARWREDVLAALRTRIYPAFERYRDTLRDRVLPHARSNDEPGIVHVSGGEKAYAAAIRKHTSLELGPREIHEFGLQEVARIRAEIAALGDKVFGTSELAAIQDKLRHDPALHFTSRAEVEATAARALGKANLAVPAVFGTLPKTPCEVLPVPEHEEKDTTIGYYREPATDGSRPGRYYINCYAPETRPRYDAEALAFHEAVPGHHLQVALAQELQGLPLIRRNAGVNAYVEGWALYTERLCDELKLYSGPLDRLGMLSFDAWRASRLVVDTGLHSLGWSRDQAIAYLRENTLLAENNVVNEVDRYIAWPGQALGYKLGQREILDLRAKAEQSLGARFSLAEFHDRVLEQGALPLPLLRRRIEHWIEQQARAAETKG